MRDWTLSKEIVIYDVDNREDKRESVAFSNILPFCGDKVYAFCDAFGILEYTVAEVSFFHTGECTFDVNFEAFSYDTNDSSDLLDTIEFELDDIKSESNNGWVFLDRASCEKYCIKEGLICKDRKRHTS